MNCTKEAKSLTFWRGSEVSQAQAHLVIVCRLKGVGLAGFEGLRVSALAEEAWAGKVRVECFFVVVG